MLSNLVNEQSNSNSPTLLIDFRSGNVEMHQGLDRWHGQLPMSKADCSQINTAQGVTVLQPGPTPSNAFELLHGSEA